MANPGTQHEQQKKLVHPLWMMMLIANGSKILQQIQGRTAAQTSYFIFFQRISWNNFYDLFFSHFLEAGYLRWEMLMGTGWIGFLQLSRVAAADQDWTSADYAATILILHIRRNSI